MKRLCWIVLAAACGRGQKAVEPTPPAVRVQSAAAAAGQSSSRYSATINPNSRVDVAFKAGGYVARVLHVQGLGRRPRLVQEGDRVVKGTEFAMLRQDDYVQRVREAEASLAEAVASHVQAKVDGDRAT